MDKAEKSVELRPISFEEIPPGGLFWSEDGNQWHRYGCTSDKPYCAVRLSDYAIRSFAGETVFINDYIDRGRYCPTTRTATRVRRRGQKTPTKSTQLQLAL